jgi:hypothetical protein
MSLRNWKHEEFARLVAGGTEAKKAFADAILKKLTPESETAAIERKADFLIHLTPSRVLDPF